MQSAMTKGDENTCLPRFWGETEGAETVDDLTDGLEMIHWVGRFTIPRDRSLATGRRRRAGA